MKFILCMAFVYHAFICNTTYISALPYRGLAKRIGNPILYSMQKWLRKAHLHFTVEDTIDSNETDWKKSFVIKYNTSSFGNDNGNDNGNNTHQNVTQASVNIQSEVDISHTITLNTSSIWGLDRIHENIHFHSYSIRKSVHPKWRKKRIPNHILGCDMRYPLKEENEKEVEKIRNMYNKLQQIRFLENNNIGVEDKLQIIEDYSILKNINKKEESLDEKESALFENIKTQFTRKGEITEMWWFYDW
jgi:hypothetical protein